MVTEFVTAQVLMVNIVAINAFTLMYYKNNLTFGKWDLKLLLHMFGLLFTTGTASLVMGQYGLAGSLKVLFCLIFIILNKALFFSNKA